MSAATKKPLVGSAESRALLKDSSIASPNRSPIRSSSSASTASTGNSVTRSRSIRGTVPTSSRATVQRQGAGSAKVSAAAENTEVNDELREANNPLFVDLKERLRKSEAISNEHQKQVQVLQTRLDEALKEKEKLEQKAHGNGEGREILDNEKREANIVLLDDLKERLRKSEELSNEYRRKAQILQTRLDEALEEKEKLGEKVHENEERIEILTNEKRVAICSKKEIEAIYEAEKVSTNKEREEASNREEELQTIIQRLRDSLNSQMNGDEELRSNRRSNNTSHLDNVQFVSSSGINHSDSQNNYKLLLQKDKLIESLRMELAESQIKIVESENMGGGRLQALEKQLLEARMKNAKLMEDNESYQVLLSEKTMNGDFSKSEVMSSKTHNTDALNALEGRSKLPSQAQELSEAEESQNDNARKLETELNLYKEQNKALTLYINKIIERLLKHRDFEAILDQSSDFRPIMNLMDKDFSNPPKESSETSALKRAKTVAMGATRRPRPQSFMPPSSHSVVTDQGTAPSIPFNLNRTNNIRTNRPHSEQFTAGASSVANQNFRNGPISPPLLGPQSPRHNAAFLPSSTPARNPNAVQRIASFGQSSTSGNFPGMISESSSTSGDSGEVNTPPSNSPPRVEKATTFAGNKPRPLRLLQENSAPDPARRAEDTVAKLAKRSSWMGWAFGKKDEAHVKKDEVHVEDNIKEN